MPERTFTICELHAAFRALEDAFANFSDVLAGVLCAGVGCDFNIPVDDRVGDQIDFFTKREGGGGRVPCTTSPCLTADEAYLRTVNEVLDNAPGLGAALQALLEAAKLEGDIRYLGRKLPSGGRRG